MEDQKFNQVQKVMEFLQHRQETPMHLQETLIKTQSEENQQIIRLTSQLLDSSTESVETKDDPVISQSSNPVASFSTETTTEEKPKENNSLSEEEVFEKVKKVIAVQFGFPVENVHRDLHLIDELKADSLERLDLIVELEEEFKFEANDGEDVSITTVGEAIDYIMKTLNQ